MTNLLPIKKTLRCLLSCKVDVWIVHYSVFKKQIDQSFLENLKESNKCNSVTINNKQTKVGELEMDKKKLGQTFYILREKEIKLFFILMSLSVPRVL